MNYKMPFPIFLDLDWHMSSPPPFLKEELRIFILFELVLEEEKWEM